MVNRPPLTPQSASITTATVAIKAMTVNGKQVTLAVFRQLYDEPLYDPMTWTAAGTPWCRVNYHPDKCDRDTVRHEHVIWQKGDELRRARVNEPTGTLDSVPRFGPGRHDDATALCIASGSFSNIEITQIRPEASWRSSTRTTWQGDPEAHIRVTYPDDGIDVAKLYLSSTDIADLIRPLSNRPHPALASAHARVHPEGRDQCVAHSRSFNALFQRHTDWLNAADQRWEEIRDLDQVFIAL